MSIQLHGSNLCNSSGCHNRGWRTLRIGNRGVRIYKGELIGGRFNAIRVRTTNVRQSVTHRWWMLTPRSKSMRTQVH
jgi:hypothetical protein